MDVVVREIVGRYGRLTVPIDRVGGADDLYALGLTSHTTVNVMLALEDRLVVEFPDELLTKSTFATLDSIATAVRSLVGPA